MTLNGICRSLLPSTAKATLTQTRAKCRNHASHGGVSGCVGIRIGPVRQDGDGVATYCLAQAMGRYRALRTCSGLPGGTQRVSLFHSAGWGAAQAELEASIAKDPVVAQHYRDILAARLHVTRLNAPVNVYASYRLANT